MLPRISVLIFVSPYDAFLVSNSNMEWQWDAYSEISMQSQCIIDLLMI